MISDDTSINIFRLPNTFNCITLDCERRSVFPVLTIRAVVYKSDIDRCRHLIVGIGEKHIEMNARQSMIKVLQQIVHLDSTRQISSLCITTPHISKVMVLLVSILYLHGRSIADDFPPSHNDTVNIGHRTTIDRYRSPRCCHEIRNCRLAVGSIFRSRDQLVYC